MAGVEVWSYWVALAGYVVAAVAIIWGVSFSSQRAARAAVWIAGFGLVWHAVAIGIRWASAGHFPYIEDYENVLVGSFVMVAAYVLASARWRGVETAGVVILPVALLTSGYGITQAGPPGPVTPPYQSGWLVVHVTFAWITYAAYSVVAGLAAVHLIRRRAEARQGEASGLPAWLPSCDRIEQLSLPLVGFGFVNNAVMIASGAIWAHRLWGSYWSWDPVETWSLLTWLGYGFYLHAKLTLKWSQTRLAWLALFCLFGILMVFWGVQLVPTSYHLFRNIGSLAPSLSRPN